MLADVPVPGEDMVEALQLLWSVMSAQDFCKYEKLVSPPKKREEKVTNREQMLWEKVQPQERLQKQEAGHAGQIAAAKIVARRAFEARGGR